MDPGTVGAWVGGIVGSLFGGAGGAMGRYVAIKNTKGPRERAFVIKASVWCAVSVVAFLVGMWLIPFWYNMLLWVPYAILLVFGIWKWSQTQQRIRQEESGQSA